MARDKKKGLLIDSVGFRNQKCDEAGWWITYLGVMTAGVGMLINLFTRKWCDTPESLEAFLESAKTEMTE